MLKVLVKKTNSQVLSINLSGHTEYDEHGRDIVCAAASTASIVTVNAIDALGYSGNIQVLMNEDGYLDIKVLETNDIIDKLLKNLIKSLEDLEKQYTSNIKIIK